ncbi:glycosyltransferase family 2 protein [Cellulophaga baltica]|uniref:Teichuronic acid biosynthesis glycosyltransferase TuaG n=1 Tax=Cellulophaga baltica TaxID=76594 RepID=A0A1G7FPF2_9FLAO|nr:glycosyltransferase family 2 protein [Cellulophaga baltica]SDE77793.1 teichuronic acid biosynthesis glycosyltransferase TuaG [Cellulophaga baltica]
MSPIVSIITPVYNSEEHLRHCLESVMSQKYVNWEHILVDDCSTDQSAEIIEQYSRRDFRIKYIKLDSNSGAGVARNTAMKNATGRFIAFLDSDDYWDENKLSKQITYMLDNKYAFTYTDYFIVEKNNPNPKYIIQSPKKIDYNKMLNNDYIGCLTAIYDKELLGLNLMPDIRKRQDWVLWLRLLQKCDYAHAINEPLANYRIGNSSLSNNKFKLLKHNFNVYHKELKMSFLKSVFMMINFLIHYFYFKLTSKKVLQN